MQNHLPLQVSKFPHELEFWVDIMISHMWENAKTTITTLDYQDILHNKHYTFIHHQHQQMVEQLLGNYGMWLSTHGGGPVA